VKTILSTKTMRSKIAPRASGSSVLRSVIRQKVGSRPHASAPGRRWVTALHKAEPPGRSLYDCPAPRSTP
jgi:hypothetical protein